jgi:spore cortex formation protein SpoVR/YcgB (stage V sporulation)
MKSTTNLIKWAFGFSLTLNAVCGLAAEHKIEVISSHRNEEQIAGYTKDVEDLTKVALDLGYKFHPVHQVTFVAAPELNQLAHTGRYALPHWIDGAEILKGMKSVSGVLEFVTQGGGIARSYYSDTSKSTEQVSIIMHVLGHNDFAQNSGYARAKNNDTMAKSLELAEYLAEVRREIGADEVDLFVQQLFSMLNLQDFIGGSYQAPSTFTSASLEVPEIKQQQVQERRRGATVNRDPQAINTPSIFSALVCSMPQTR